MCSRRAFRITWCPTSVVLYASSTISLNIIFSQTAGPIWTKLGWNVPWEVLFKSWTESDSIKNSGCHGNGMEFFKQFFKNLLLWNHWSDFEISSQECSMGDPFQKFVTKFWLSINMALVNGDLLQYMDMKKSSSLKALVRFWNNFTVMFLACPFQKLFAKFWSVHNHGSGEWGLLALYCDMKKFLT